MVFTFLVLFKYQYAINLRMPRLPQRQSLPTQTAEIILEMVKAGEFTNSLPGERTLANQLQINPLITP